MATVVVGVLDDVGATDTVEDEVGVEVGVVVVGVVLEGVTVADEDVVGVVLEGATVDEGATETGLVVGPVT